MSYMAIHSIDQGPYWRFILNLYILHVQISIKKEGVWAEDTVGS